MYSKRNVYRSALVPRNLPCPKIFLVSPVLHIVYTFFLDHNKNGFKELKENISFYIKDKSYGINQKNNDESLHKSSLTFGTSNS